MTRYFDPRNLVQESMDSVGDGTGVFNLTGNYSSGPTTFKYKPPPGFITHIDGLTVVLEANGEFKSNEYIPGSALTNGIHFRHFSANDEIERLRLPILSLGNLKDIGSFSIFSVGGGGSEFSQGNNPINFVFIKISIIGLFLQSLDVNGSNGEEFQVILNDNFSTLAVHYFFVHGNREVVEQ